MPEPISSTTVPMDLAKFQDPLLTAKGEERAVVSLTQLHTVWFNTGSLCNITCNNCYMDSSPTNDKLEYLSLSQVVTYLDEVLVEGYPVEKIAFTGGEPFMNKDLPAMIAPAWRDPERWRRLAEDHRAGRALLRLEGLLFATRCLFQPAYP